MTIQRITITNPTAISPDKSEVSKCIVFTDLSHFIRYADSVPSSVARYGKRLDPDNNMGQGTASYDEASMLARRGWTAGARAISAVLSGVAGSVSRISQSFAASIYRDVAPSGSAYIDPVSFTIGAPDPWVCTDDDRGSAGSRVIRLITNQAASADMSARDMFIRGAAVCAATMLLEAANIKTEVWQGSQSTFWDGPPCHIQTRVCIKRADERLSRDTAAFMLTHAASQRRMVWAVREGNGFSPKFTSPSKMIFSPSDDMISISDIVDGLYGNKWDMNALMRHVRSICERVGVTFPDSFIENLKGMSIPTV